MNSLFRHYTVGEITLTIYIYILLLLFRWSPFIPSRNLDQVFTYNHMAQMSLRS